jgi:hypothetical protein
MTLKKIEVILLKKWQPSRSVNRYSVPVVNTMPIQNVRIHTPYTFGIPQPVIQPMPPNWNPYNPTVQQHYNPMQQSFNQIQQTVTWPQQVNWAMQSLPISQYQLPSQDQSYWQQVPHTTWLDPNINTNSIVQITQQQQQNQQEQQNPQSYNDWTPAMATNVTNSFNK